MEDCSIDVETGSDWDEFGSDYKAEFLRRRRSWVQQEMALCTVQKEPKFDADEF